MNPHPMGLHGASIFRVQSTKANHKVATHCNASLHTNIIYFLI